MSHADFKIRKIAHLARLELTDDEVSEFEKQVADIIDYVAKLDALDVEEIEPTAHANPVLNVMRPDESRPGFTQEQALANAPKVASNQFQVTKVVD